MPEKAHASSINLLLTSSRRCLVATTRICEPFQKVFDVNDLHPISFCQTQSEMWMLPSRSLYIRYAGMYVRTHSNDCQIQAVVVDARHAGTTGGGALLCQEALIT